MLEEDRLEEDRKLSDLEQWGPRRVVALLQSLWLPDSRRGRIRTLVMQTPHPIWTPASFYQHCFQHPCEIALRGGLSLHDPTEW